MSKFHQDVTFPASPAKVYAALMDSTQHAAFTGEPADIGQAAGDAFSAYGGKVHGVNIELVPGKRIVQVWRAGNWAEGVFSLIRFELSGEGNETKLSFDHDAIPEVGGEHLEQGWKNMYWDKLTAYLGS